MLADVFSVIFKKIQAKDAGAAGTKPR